MHKIKTYRSDLKVVTGKPGTVLTSLAEKKNKRDGKKWDQKKMAGGT